jgi:protoheme IX farnesyltransferase
MIRTYYLLTKPGIIVGNLITTGGAFALASKGHIDFSLFLVTLLGLGLVIASACVFNNCIDRENDKKMARTKNRPLPKGLISVRSALLFATLLGFLGCTILALGTNSIALYTALMGFVVYVILYSFSKVRTVYGTLIGSASGAIPPVVGYTAVSGRFDLGAALLFLILILWQMPHFYAIAMYRLEDYSAASIPTLPAVRGSEVTKIRMILYVLAFTLALPLLVLTGHTGYIYLALATPLSVIWLWICYKGIKAEDDKIWARSVFRFSLFVIVGLSGLMAFDPTS